MSIWEVPMVAAKNAVTPPTMATVAAAAGAQS